MKDLLKILIVDDKPENLLALDQVLKPLKAGVIKAGRGNDALIASLNHDFALAIIDVQMPGMDGYELAELLRSQEQTRRLPIIFLSAVYHEEYYVFKGYEAGAVDFISKPYETKILLSKVGVFLELARQRIECRQMAEKLTEVNEALERRVQERAAVAEARARQLQSLAVELIGAEERERRRIAEILHDDLQQLLAAARLQLAAASQSLPVIPALESVKQILNESMAKSRHLSHELSPSVLHHSGLIAALEWLSKRMETQFGLKVLLEVDAAQLIESTPLKLFLFRAAQELLFNVVKHAGVKSACVILFGSAGHIAIEVSDQGEGFNPADLDGSPMTTGFGLLRLRERARCIGGNLLIDSAPGKGSRFTFTLPIEMEGADGTHQGEWQHLVEAHVPAQYPKSVDTEGARVLFVDDHRVMRQGLIRLIADQPGIKVVGEAANGMEALEQTRQIKPDVVVMDISMPEMDGVEATRRIKAEFPDVHVIGLSVYDDEAIATTMHQAGAESLLNKTASSADLLRAIYGFFSHSGNRLASGA